MNMKLAELCENRIVVYTVIIGAYDYLKDPDYVMEHCDYICFTNNPKLKSDSWQIRFVPHTQYGDSRLSRRYKILAHEYLSEYECSIYVDGNVRIIGDFREYIRKESGKAPILCLKHPSRSNVYEEAEECIRLQKEKPEIIQKQMEKYREEGFPEDQGLITASILVRKHMDQDVVRLMELWWSELEQGAGRDQLSFNYACWKLGMEYDASELKCWKSPYWMNPGIHTAQIRKVEEELIAHIQLEAFMAYQISEKDKYIAWKEQELKDADTQLGWKEQELRDANTQLRWKEQELKDANTQLGWKENERKELEKQLNRIEQQLSEMLASTSWKCTGWLRKIKTFFKGRR